MTSQVLLTRYPTLVDDLAAFNAQWQPSVTSRALSIAALRRVYIPGAVQGLEGADVGVNYYLTQLNRQHLAVFCQAYPDMAAGDFIEVFWARELDSAVAVVTAYVREDQVGQHIELLIPAGRLVEGFAQVWCSVTRAVTGNADSALPLSVFYKRSLPGGPDREPDFNWHSELLAPVVPRVITADSLGEYVTVGIDAYPYMRVNDQVYLSWGGEIFIHIVLAQEVGTRLYFQLPASSVRAAGDGLAIPVVYQVIDEVQNISEKWSARAIVSVEVSDDLIDAPVTKGAMTGELNLGELAGKAVEVTVSVVRGVFKVKDQVQLTLLGTTAQGGRIEFKPGMQEVKSVPSTLTFLIPNAEAIKLAGGSAVAGYLVNRAGELLYRSMRAEVRLSAAVARLPAPDVEEAVNGWLDNALSSAHVVVPAFVGMSLGDRYMLRFEGTTRTGSSYLHTQVYPISKNEVGKAVSIEVERQHIEVLLGRLQVSYEVEDDAATDRLESQVLTLQVGPLVAQLPAPTVPEVDAAGVLAPTKLGASVQVLVTWRSELNDRDTVTLEWKSSSAAASYSNTSSVVAGQDVSFKVPKAIVLAGEGQVVEVRYLVRSVTTGLVRLSRTLRISVGSAIADPLPAPSVPQAEQPEGIRLDPLKVLNGGSVVVAYPGMAGGDMITVYTRMGDVISFPGSNTGRVEVPVPPHVVGMLIGRFVRLGYRAVRNGRSYESAPLDLQVLPLPTSNLPRLVIPQTKEASLLDLKTFSGDAQLTVAPWPFIAVGQTYWVEVSGVNGSGQPVSVLLERNKLVTGAMVREGIKEALPRAALEQLALKSQLVARLRVAFDGDESTGTQSFAPLDVVLGGGSGTEIIDEDFHLGLFPWKPYRTAEVQEIDGVTQCVLTAKFVTASNYWNGGISRTIDWEPGHYELRLRLKCELSYPLGVKVLDATLPIGTTPQWQDVVVTFTISRRGSDIFWLYNGASRQDPTVRTMIEWLKLTRLS